MTLSLARRLIFQGLPWASSYLGGHPIVMGWTGYIWLRGCPTRTPRVHIHLEGCWLPKYYWPIKLMDVANQARQQRRCEGWSYVINLPGSEIQVIFQMEPVRHHGPHDLLKVDISSLCPTDSLPKSGCPMA